MKLNTLSAGREADSAFMEDLYAKESYSPNPTRDVWKEWNAGMDARDQEHREAMTEIKRRIDEGDTSFRLSPEMLTDLHSFLHSGGACKCVMFADRSTGDSVVDKVLHQWYWRER